MRGTQETRGMFTKISANLSENSGEYLKEFREILSL